MNIRPDKIEIGQHWMRKNRQVVRIDDERLSRGSREVLLVPINGDGRKSWKCDKAILRELIYCGN